MKQKLSKDDLGKENIIESLLNTIMFWKDDNVDALTHHLDDYFFEKRNSQFNDLENIKWIRNGLLREMYRVVGGEKDRIRVSLYKWNS